MPHPILQLHAPWPAGLSRASWTAARAVRDAIASNATSVEFAASESEWQRMLHAGVRPTLLHADAGHYFELRSAADDGTRPLVDARRLAASSPPLLGSMGGYFTNAEVHTEMNRLASAYPSWVRPPVSVGTSREGRAIEVTCVTADPSACAAKSALPTVLYTGLVHAREPATVMCLIHSLRRLLEDASSGGMDALHILAHRKLLFLPVANPDGYAWNQAHRPRGGGMKRKNGAKCCSRRPNSEDDGVDVNRNFAFKFAYDNIGSESEGCSEMWRGPFAFSEPETQAIRDLVTTHAPAAVLHWHGWGNDLALPFSYDWRAPMSAADLETHQEFGAEMSARNHYAVGRAWESVGYPVNGEADDWSYGEHGAVSMTMEVGNSRDSFWPSPSRILPIAEESVWPARYIAWAAGPQLQLSSLFLEPNSTAAGGEEANPNSALLRLVVQANGLRDVRTGHKLCACASRGGGGTALSGSADWVSSAASDAAAPAASSAAVRCAQPPECMELRELRARSSVTLPALRLAWPAANGQPSPSFVKLLLQWSAPSPAPTAGGQAAATAGGDAIAAGSSISIDIHTVGETRRGCAATPELCMCSPDAVGNLKFSHTCKAAIKQGSHCMAPKAAIAGENAASGVEDEFFAYKPAASGTCHVSATRKDTIITVYAECGRWGARAPLAFQNSETRVPDVSFPCDEGKT